MDLEGKSNEERQILYVNGVRGRPGVGETHSGEACPGRVPGGRCCLRVEGACNPGDCLRVAKVWDA